MCACNSLPYMHFGVLKLIMIRRRSCVCALVCLLEGMIVKLIMGQVWTRGKGGPTKSPEGIDSA